MWYLSCVNVSWNFAFLAEILKNGDLATLTSKKIRQILEEKYEMNLKDRYVFGSGNLLCE